MIQIGKLKTIQTVIVECGTYVEPQIIFTETLDTNLYEDITNNDNWMLLGLQHYDYLACRKQVMYRTAVIGFDKLDIEEQKCASKHFAVGKTDRDLVHTEAEQMANWNVFVSESQKIRLERWVKAKGYISYQLVPADSTDLALNTETLSKNFVEYGIESLAIDGVTGIYDWLTDVYPTKPYFNQTHSDNIMLILTTGVY